MHVFMLPAGTGTSLLCQYITTCRWEKQDLALLSGFQNGFFSLMLVQVGKFCNKIPTSYITQHHHKPQCSTSVCMFKDGT